MTNLEKLIQELETQLKNGFIPNAGIKLKKLLEIIKVQNEALNIIEQHRERSESGCRFHTIEASIAKRCLEKTKQIAGSE